MTEAEKTTALALWQAKWDKFVTELVAEYSNEKRLHDELNSIDAQKRPDNKYSK